MTSSRPEHGVEIRVITEAGMVHDASGRRAMGVLVSDRHQWGLRHSDPATVYEFRSAGSPPEPIGRAHVYRHDPPPPNQDSGMVNRILPAIYGMAERGVWKPKREGSGQWRYVICLLAVAACLGMAYLSYSKDETQVQHVEQAQTNATSTAPR